MYIVNKLFFKYMILCAFIPFQYISKNMNSPACSNLFDYLKSTSIDFLYNDFNECAKNSRTNKSYL